jgi:hypothetical protein
MIRSHFKLKVCWAQDRDSSVSLTNFWRLFSSPLLCYPSDFWFGVLMENKFLRKNTISFVGIFLLLVICRIAGRYWEGDFPPNCARPRIFLKLRFCIPPFAHEIYFSESHKIQSLPLMNTQKTC